MLIPISSSDRSLARVGEDSALCKNAVEEKTAWGLLITTEGNELGVGPLVVVTNTRN